MRIVQKLVGNDATKRMSFAKAFLENLEREPDIINNLVISDECTFKTNGALNRQNRR